MQILLIALILLIIAVIIDFTDFLYPNINPNVEDAEIVEKIGSHFPHLLLLNHILWYCGVTNIFITDQWYRKTMSFIRNPTGLKNNGVKIYKETWSGVNVVIFDGENESLESSSRSAIVYYHGGGYVLGSAEIYAPLTSELAKRTGSIVFSIDYRLAPDYLCPTAFEDAKVATLHLFKDSYKLWNVNRSLIFLAGDSAGGQTAAAMVPILYQANFTSRGVLLLYPVLQTLSFSTPSYLENANDFLLSRVRAQYLRMLYHQGNTQKYFYEFQNNFYATDAIRQYYANKYNLSELLHKPSHLLTKSEDDDDDGQHYNTFIQQFRHLYEDERNSPLFIDNLSIYPAIFLLSCEYDILRDDSLMFLRRLQAINHSVNHIHKACFHGMISYFTHYKPANQTLNEISHFVYELLANKR